MSLRLLTPEQINALTSMTAPDLRKRLELMRVDIVGQLPAVPLDEPAKIETLSFKGPESDIPIRVYTPEGQFISGRTKIWYNHKNFVSVINL
jgi:hypothetical protein